MKKAQAAMEFLMTYGVAIIVVLAALSVFAYFFGWSPQKMMPSKCVLTPGFGFADCKASTDGLIISVTNGLGVDAKNLTLEVKTTAASDVYCNETWVMTGGLENKAATGLHQMCNGTYSEGLKFDAHLIAYYVKVGEEVSHSTKGTVSRIIEI